MGDLYMVNDNEMVITKDILKAFADLESSNKMGAINKVIITSTPGGSNHFADAFKNFNVLHTAREHLSKDAKTAYEAAKRGHIKK